jgi:hypothetical protein
MRHAHALNHDHGNACYRAGLYDQVNDGRVYVHGRRDHTHAFVHGGGHGCYDDDCQNLQTDRLENPFLSPSDIILPIAF